MSQDIDISRTIKKRLSEQNDSELKIEVEDSFSMGEKNVEILTKQKREILQKVLEMWNEAQQDDNQSDEESLQIMNYKQKQELFEDLDEEYGQSYQEVKVKINSYLKLIPKNDLQLAFTYTDKYPLIKVRKRILISIKTISSWAQLIVTNPVFEVLTLLVILFNSLTLAMADPTSNVQTSNTDIFFLAYYSTEAFLKILAYVAFDYMQGFIIPKKAYLKDTWNILDFCVIITAYIPYFVSSNSINLNALRSFRVLRPLRTVSTIKVLRTILLALFASFAQLRDAFVFLIFFYSIFAIAGVQLFSGYLKRRCFSELSGIELDESRLCADDSNCPFPDENIFQENFICGKQIANPQNNLINFDTFSYAYLQVFIVITLEGWTQIQEAVILTFSQFIVIYFYIVVVIGSFFLINLTLAVLKLHFKPEKIQEEIAQIKEVIDEYDYRQLRDFKLYVPLRTELDTQGQEDQVDIIFRKKQTEGKGSLIQANFQRMRKKQNSQQSGTDEKNSSQKSNKLIKVPRIQLITGFDDKIDYINSPILDLQADPLNGGTVVLNRRDSNDSSESNISKDEKVNQLEIPKFMQIKDKSQNSCSNNKVQGMKFQKPPKLEHIQDRQPLGENEFDSVNLSELNTISEEEIEQLDEIDIFVDVKQKIEQQKQHQKEMNRLKKLEIWRLKELEKKAQENKDELAQKLKSKLFNIQLYPIVKIDEEYISIHDVLISKFKLELMRQKLEKDQKIREMKTKISYCFKNYKQSLEIKSSNSKGINKNLSKKNIQQNKNKNNLRQIRIIPVTDEPHPYEDLQNPTDRNIEDPEIQENLNSEGDEEINSGKSLNCNASNRIRNRRKRSKSKDRKEKLNFEQIVQKFKENSDCMIDMNKLKSVENQKQFSAQELVVLSLQEQELQKSLFYQEYWDIKTKDIQESNGKINSQTSIEDVLLISDYTFYDQKFAKQMNSIMKALNYTERETFIYLKGIFGILQILQKYLLVFVQSPQFEAVINIAVALNTIILALDGLVSNNQSNLLSDFNTAFTIIFTIDLGLKVLGMGPSSYISDSMNVFDALIVALSLIELFLLGGGGGSGKSSISAFRSVRIFRAFRVLRVTKLMRSLQFMGFLLKVLINSFQSIMYISILMVLFIFIFMLLGMAFFGGNITNQPVRQNFDDLQNAFLVVFQVLTLENWNAIIWNYLIQPDLQPWITIPYLVSWILIGNWVFLNLFLAILLEFFEQEYKGDRAGLDTNIEIGQDSFIENTTQPNISTIKSLMKIKQHAVAEQLENNGDQETEKRKKLLKQFVYFSEPGLCQRSLYIFSQDSLIRKIFYRVVKDQKFESGIFFMIFLTSAKLVFDTYIQNNTGQLRYISLQIDIFFATFFALEMMMKIIAFGLVQDDNSYLRESWNILDFFIVIASLIDVSVSSINLSFVKILRLLRTLRPLRFITHNRSMKILVSALLQSINGIFNVTIVVVLVWLMFAILGINLQKGKMHYCDFGDSKTYYNIGSDECVEQGGIWNNRKTNFDNIGSGMLTLFILSTMEGWPDYMYYFIDADESGPIKGGQMQFTWFFIGFILVGSILSINLFVGVILVNYHLAEEASRDKILTQPQVDWIDLQKLIVLSNPNLAMFFCPENKFRAIIFKIIKHKFFDPTIITVIIFNIVVMALYIDDGPVFYGNVLSDLNTAFTCVFIAEAILKIIALGPVGYMRNSWNQFDFFVVCASILDFVLQFTGNTIMSFLSSGPQIARVFRVLRVTRLFRLIKQFEGLQKLIDTAVYSLPAMLNVIALLFLVLFIFAILGVFLFGSITSGQSIDENQNFTDFHHSFELLFRCATGEDWYKVMFDTMDYGSQYYCIYWIIFIVIQDFIMLNLFVLIILDQYDINYFNNDNPINKFQEYENMFIESWSKFAKEDKGMKMHLQYLVPLLLDMEKPIGYDLKTNIEEQITEWKRINSGNEDKQIIIIKANAKKVVSTAIMKMNIYADSKGFVKYHQILYSVMKSYMWRKVKIDLTSEGAKRILIKEDQTLRKLKQKNFITVSKDVQLVNPIVQFLFVSMALKALKRFGEKKKQQREGLQQRIEKNEEYYSEGFSSDSSYTKKVEIVSRVDNERPHRLVLTKGFFVNLPNTDVYKDQEYVTKNQNSSQSNSEVEAQFDENEDMQYIKDSKIKVTSGIFEDEKSSRQLTNQVRPTQILKQPKRRTLKPSTISRVSSKKSILNGQVIKNNQPKDQGKNSKY